MKKLIMALIEVDKKKPEDEQERVIGKMHLRSSWGRVEDVEKDLTKIKGTTGLREALVIHFIVNVLREMPLMMTKLMMDLFFEERERTDKMRNRFLKTLLPFMDDLSRVRYYKVGDNE